MIKLENVVLASPEQMEFIIQGMRNPMNSWEKSDTCFSDVPCVDCYDGQRDLCNKTSFLEKMKNLDLTTTRSCSAYPMQVLSIGSI